MNSARRLQVGKHSIKQFRQNIQLEQIIYIFLYYIHIHMARYPISYIQHGSIPIRASAPLHTTPCRGRRRRGGGRHGCRLPSEGSGVKSSQVKSARSVLICLSVVFLSGREFKDTIVTRIPPRCKLLLPARATTWPRQSQ